MSYLDDLNDWITSIVGWPILLEDKESKIENFYQLSFLLYQGFVINFEKDGISYIMKPYQAILQNAKTDFGRQGTFNFKNVDVVEIFNKDAKAPEGSIEESTNVYYTSLNDGKQVVIYYPVAKNFLMSKSTVETIRYGKFKVNVSKTLVRALSFRTFVNVTYDDFSSKVLDMAYEYNVSLLFGNSVSSLVTNTTKEQKINALTKWGANFEAKASSVIGKPVMDNFLCGYKEALELQNTGCLLFASALEFLVKENPMVKKNALILNDYGKCSALVNYYTVTNVVPLMMLVTTMIHTTYKHGKFDPLWISGKTFAGFTPFILDSVNMNLLNDDKSLNSLPIYSNESLLSKTAPRDSYFVAEVHFSVPKKVTSLSPVHVKHFWTSNASKVWGHWILAYEYDSLVKTLFSTYNFPLTTNMVKCEQVSDRRGNEFVISKLTKDVPFLWANVTNQQFDKSKEFIMTLKPDGEFKAIETASLSHMDDLRANDFALNQFAQTPIKNSVKDSLTEYASTVAQLFTDGVKVVKSTVKKVIKKPDDLGTPSLNVSEIKGVDVAFVSPHINEDDQGALNQSAVHFKRNGISTTPLQITPINTSFFRNLEV